MFSSILFRLFALFLFITFCLNYCSTTNIVCSSYRYRYWLPRSSNAEVNVRSTLCLPPLPVVPKENTSLAESKSAKTKVKTQLLTTSASKNEQTTTKAIPENLMSESIHFEDDNESAHTGENNFFNENHNRNKNTFYGIRRTFDDNFQRTNKPDAFYPRFKFPSLPQPSHPNPSIVYFPKEIYDHGYSTRNHGDNDKKNIISSGGFGIRPFTNIEITKDNLNNNHQIFNDNSNKNHNKNENDELINKNNEHSNDKNSDRGKQYTLNNRYRDRIRNKDFIEIETKVSKKEEKQPGNGNGNHNIDENNHDINKNTAVNKNRRGFRKQHNRNRSKQRNYKKDEGTSIDATTIRSIISRSRNIEKIPVIDINDERNHDHVGDNNNKDKNDNIEINHNYNNKKLSYPKNLHENDMKSIIVKGSNAFGFKLLRSLIKKDANENIILSPFSLYSLLIILYSGSDGSTRTEFKNLLQLNSVEKNEIEKSFMHLKDSILGEIQSLKLLNLLVVNNNFKILSDFSEKVNNFYKAKLYSANFLSEGEDIKDHINFFVNNATDGKIKQVLKNKPATSTKLFLLNSVLFKDKWLEKFNPDLTESHDFKNLDGSTSKVNMMRGTMEIYLNCEIEPFKVCTVRLPYLLKNISMIMMIPDKSENLNDLSNSLNENFIDSAVSKLEHKTREFGLPKFELISNIDLQSLLEENGLRKIFTPNEADLSHMTNNRYLYVKKIKHQSVIEVNEEGTSAASTSYAFLSTRRSPSKFYINKPFIFLIKDLETDLILFIGRINHLSI